MRKLICILVVVLVGISTLVFAETSKIINKKNEYGGKTVLHTFSPGDSGDQQGIVKAIEYYTGNEKVVKMEMFYNKKEAQKEGTDKSIDYYNSNEKKVKMEMFRTKEYAREYGVAKTIVYYDGNGKRMKGESYGKNGSLLKTY